MGNKSNICITDYDLERLRELLRAVKRSGTQKEALIKLGKELERARVISSGNVPADLITMNSKVRIKNVDTNEEMVFQIVFPSDANLDDCRISILAPVGTALIGYKIGDTVRWQVPAGIRKLQIEEILYQPEAAGDIYL